MLARLFFGALMIYSGFTIVGADPAETVMHGRGIIGLPLALAANLGLPYPMVGAVAVAAGIGILTYPWWADRVLGSTGRPAPSVVGTPR